MRAETEGHREIDPPVVRILPRDPDDDINGTGLWTAKNTGVAPAPEPSREVVGVQTEHDARRTDDVVESDHSPTSSCCSRISAGTARMYSSCGSHPVPRDSSSSPPPPSGEIVYGSIAFDRNAIRRALIA